MTNLVWIDGEWLTSDQASISVFDHGLLYGDGVYEGIRAYSGHIFKYQEHFNRLVRSARGIGLTLPISNAQMKTVIVAGMAKAGLENAYIRIVVTRGSGPIGPDPGLCTSPKTIVILKDIPPLHGDDTPSISTAISTIRRVGIDSNPAEIKSLNYLPSVMGKAEANRIGVDDVILLDPFGFVSEAPVANLFIQEQGRILTPGVANGILSGITRGFVIELLGELGYEVDVGNITPTQVLNAEEAFLTGTHAELVSIGYHNGMKITGDFPGDTFMTLQEKFNAAKTQSL
ncbi:MAG: aminotransferase class IV [Nitrosospira sp.]|nr:aminotransferase class IV [Nitrosospira sp.]